MPRIPVDTDTGVYLATAFIDAAWENFSGQALVVVPQATWWNDFSRNFRAELHFVGFPHPHPPISMRLMFEAAGSVSHHISSSVGKRAHLEIGQVEEAFVSVLEDATSYRAIVNHMGFDAAFASLRRLHDIVVAGLEDDDLETLNLARGMDFAQGVLRDDSTWTAYRQGGRYLTPTGNPDVEDAAMSFDVSVQLDGFPSRHALDADFGNDFPFSRRILVLVGENGVGKTRLFGAMIDGLRQAPSWESDQEVSPPIFDPAPQFSRLVVFSSAATDPYPRALPPWIGLDYRFHRMAGHSPGADDDLAQSLLDCRRSAYGFDGAGGRHGMRLLDEVLQPLGIRDDLFVEVTSATQEEDRLPTPVRVGDRLYLPFFGSMGEQRRLQLQARMVPGASPQVLTKSGQLRNLSSGEQALLRFVTQAIGSLQIGTMFLFDEPETHLHPRYVSLFMSMLDRILELSGSIALVATHSSFIVREVPARRVRILRSENDGSIVIEPPGMQTFGANIDTISQFVFSDIVPKHRFQETLDNWLSETPEATLQLFRERFEKDLNAETLSYFAQIVEERLP